jgi:hypothetical protein
MGKSVVKVCRMLKNKPTDGNPGGCIGCGPTGGV